MTNQPHGEYPTDIVVIHAANEHEARNIAAELRSSPAEWNGFKLVNTSPIIQKGSCVGIIIHKEHGYPQNTAGIKYELYPGQADLHSIMKKFSIRQEIMAKHRK